MLRSTLQEMSDKSGNLDTNKLVQALTNAKNLIESLQDTDLRQQRMENARLEKLLVSEKHATKEAKARATAAEEKLQLLERL